MNAVVGKFFFKRKLMAPEFRQAKHYPYYFLLFQYMYCAYFIISYYDQQMHTIISQIITLLHVSTLPCHPQTACNQYLAKLHKYFKCSCFMQTCI